MTSLRVGHYGINGHAVLGQLKDHPRVRLSAVCEVPWEKVVEILGEGNPILSDVVQCDTLEELLDQCDLVVFCSPIRHEQFGHTVTALKAGKHVLAEKPCAFSYDEVDQLLELDAKGPARFRQMAETTLHPAFRKMRKYIEEGRIGSVICQQALKSYPMMPSRPKDESIDGGLLMQAGIHGVRALQEVTGLTITSASAVEYAPGTHGDLRMAAAATCLFDNHTVGTLTVNYGNPPGIGFWGNDQLRVWGTAGMIEAVDGLTRLRYCPTNGPFEDLPIGAEGPTTYFDRFVGFLLDDTPMPLPLARELQSTRTVIAMKEAARTGQMAKVG